MSIGKKKGDRQNKAARDGKGSYWMGKKKETNLLRFKEDS